jgi:hypothetical protein
MEIKPLYQEQGTAMDFTVLENLLEKSLTKNLLLKLGDTPLLLTENSIH